MAEINAAQLAKQSVQSVKWWVIMQRCARPRPEAEQQTLQVAKARGRKKQVFERKGVR